MPGQVQAASQTSNRTSVQFTHRDDQHRTRLADLDDPVRQRWLTIPTRLPHGRSTLIRDALIDDADLARRSSAGMLRQHRHAGVDLRCSADLIARHVWSGYW
ncbi:hypothetical protein M878_44015 [Streptomyces roseochromogenus subsp. oscitans DS 12.976]|uniref:Uncharacterized protein n=1 Tax=Streptomyces roseochromogenus subsp. oscitans DS 12.976 TaxID=1352936 RepID=V6JGA6_STRRC|nr:hypothetical protein M878_44015 [Streptomyces roseochromogenus subsp. oscitans DS 12.976]